MTANARRLWAALGSGDGSWLQMQRREAVGSMSHRSDAIHWLLEGCKMPRNYLSISLEASNSVVLTCTFSNALQFGWNRIALNVGEDSQAR